MPMHDSYGGYDSHRYEYEERMYEQRMERERQEADRRKKRDEHRNKVRGVRNRDIKKISEYDYEEFQFKLEMLGKEWRIISTFKDESDWVAICECERQKPSKMIIKDSNE